MFHQSLKMKLIKPLQLVSMLQKPRVVYNTRVMLLSAKKDSVPTTQKVVWFMNCCADVKLGT